MATPRDPHLPPPEVCDWLLQQEWSNRIPETNIIYSQGPVDGVIGSGLFNHHLADPAVGADGIGKIYLPDETLQALRDDAAVRLEDRAEDRAEDHAQAPEAQLIGEILDLIHDAGLTLCAAVGVLEWVKASILYTPHTAVERRK